MSDLRDRIAAALGNVEVVLDGWDYLNETSKFLLADAVIAALPELTQPVSVEPIGDYQYVCHPCGSSFSFYSSSTMQQFALMHSGSHGDGASSSYADHFCRGGCDCSCCYGMADEPCHCRDAICNCGGDRAAHGQKPLEDK